MADSSDDNLDMRDRLMRANVRDGFDSPSTQFYREYIVRCLIADGEVARAMEVISETRAGRLGPLSELAPGRYRLHNCLATVGRVESDPATKVAHFEAVVAVSNGVLGPSARDSLEFRLRLAEALIEDGQLDRAVDVVECLFVDAAEVLHPHDPLLADIDELFGPEP